MRARPVAGRPRGLREPLHRVLVMNRAGGRVADVELDYGAFPGEGPTVWIDEGMASVIMDQCDGEFWAEAARLTGTTGPNGKDWTERTMPGILRHLRQQAALVRSNRRARAERPWSNDEIAEVVRAAGMCTPEGQVLPTASMVAAHLRRRGAGS